ncbi:hypothetical protein K470DRAFT_268868 [Piedraia hortae CBS 480.64]|uniref:Uncharacterized protein n=1 Tax=Piedraia hortae CBS 480.64 TaxID=1314780 RepID=A0A6A7C5L0_9PEZI|nr:hypothetical protein K470DRAFT_268868 [Piedraia hortae CBS 480.64]
MYEVPGFDTHQNFSYENLHYVLLGYVELLWNQTLRDSTVKPDRKELAVQAVAINRDGIHSMVTAQRFMDWNKYLLGGDFRMHIQALPLILVSFYASIGAIQRSDNFCICGVLRQC